ncbi:MAG: hypothetical protein ACOH2H_23000 [Cypionkella sp.]
MNTRIFSLDQENASLALLSSGQATNAESAQLMAAAMALNGGQMDSASTSTVALCDAQVKLNTQLKKNAANPLRDYMNSLPTMVSATKQTSADIASTLRDGISSAMTGEFNLKGLVDNLRHKLADGLAGALEGKLLGALGLGDTTGAGAYSSAILTTSMTGATMFATAISTGSMAGAGVGAAGAAAGGGGWLSAALTWGASLFGFSEGGYSDGAGVGKTYAMSPAMFHNAPHYKEGTTNTTGGGIPAVLHPNEAVIPLSRGRSIPVEMKGGTTKDWGGNVFNVATTVNVGGGNGGGDVTNAGAMAEHVAMMVGLRVQEEMANQMRYGGMMNPRGGR